MRHDRPSPVKKGGKKITYFPLLVFGRRTITTPFPSAPVETLLETPWGQERETTKSCHRVGNVVFLSMTVRSVERKTRRLSSRRVVRCCQGQASKDKRIPSHLPTTHKHTHRDVANTTIRTGTKETTATDSSGGEGELVFGASFRGTRNNKVHTHREKKNTTSGFGNLLLLYRFFPGTLHCLGKKVEKTVVKLRKQKHQGDKDT